MRWDHKRSRIGLALVTHSSSPMTASCRPERQLGVDPGLAGHQQQLFETTGLGPGEWLVAHLAVGRPAPEALGLGEEPHALARAAAGQLAAALRHDLLEPEDVGHLGGHREHVARRPRHDHVLGRSRLAQALAEARDGRTQRDLGSRPVVVGPQRVHQPVDRDDDVAIDQEPGHERPRLDAPDVDGAPVPRQLDGAEHPDLQAGGRRGHGEPHDLARRIAPRHAGPLPLAPRSRRC